MTRDTIPILVCDGDEGFCGEEVTDHYEQGAIRVNGKRVSASERYPGWRTEGDEDYCPKHQNGDRDA